ncbi:alkaline proteinase inhibitor [Pseudomonas gingeri NCPPB 3146 = LMG 5327]|uniref:Protease inhibitor Inh/omp19 family protein n=3 Tax=Pseudomonas gingeri TaxID=117681 RepID=A0A7Y8CBY3_9PSED|nr:MULTISPECIES: protease inhibitor Inh/omp19 family protein [Pseudomonas]NVZ24188.1 protease inhibitor Inh/omp19 family protein [Pseudomonas gingeri]NWA11180.1 protease inhibitor Inh/omp19 family protein [Pseudomonas gingeri]NWC13735.1 protease inhibitor Inh/omp19 family protein [Pseudomonas gingeri]NWE45043.1 protease inhibitor Inh/omp19 family protein [Pseudomonas gingeri]NWE70270.1 protease inhibitor Inh/omp19 family protein [Pseudomonas gingeri]
MARSLILPSPETLAGSWRLYREDDRAQACELVLAVQAPSLGGDLECVAGWLGERPARWEPTPDGLWLYGVEGSGIVHLNRQGNDLYQARLASGVVLVLERLQP